jgi:hypothetical protein
MRWRAPTRARRTERGRLLPPHPLQPGGGAAAPPGEGACRRAAHPAPGRVARADRRPGPAFMGLPAGFLAAARHKGGRQCPAAADLADRAGREPERGHAAGAGRPGRGRRPRELCAGAGPVRRRQRGGGRRRADALAGKARGRSPAGLLAADRAGGLGKGQRGRLSPGGGQQAGGLLKARPDIVSFRIGWDTPWLSSAPSPSSSRMPPGAT